MPVAARSIRLEVPESVFVSSFGDIRRLLERVLGDENLRVHVLNHPAEGSPSRPDLKNHVLGFTAGTFTLEEFQTAAETLFKHFDEQLHIYLKEEGGVLVWEHGLQLS